MSRTITSYRSIFAPWEEGQDEPTLTDTDTRTYDCEPDEIDQADLRTAVEIAADVLQYVTDASVFPFHPGAWYSDETYVRPYTGEIEEVTYHLDGFTDAEQIAIHDAVLPQRAPVRA
jgi:hypothetical protein